MAWHRYKRHAGAAMVLGFGAVLLAPGCVVDLAGGCEDTWTCEEVVENCLDGYDNNGDDLVDCADPQCAAGVECVSLPERNNWKLAVVTEHAYPSPKVERCPDGSEPLVYYTNPSEAACEPCQCTPQGGECSAPRLACYLGEQCNNDSLFEVTSPKTACVADPQLIYEIWGIKHNLGSCKVLANAIPPTFTASGGGLLEPNLWGGEVHVCISSALSGGCSEGQICAGRRASKELRSCLVFEGTADCPKDWRGSKLVAYESGKEGRDCADCKCDVTKAHCEGGKYTVYDWDGCDTNSDPNNDYEEPIDVLPDGKCVDLSDHLDGTGNGTGSFLPTAAMLTVGSDVAIGGTPSGKVNTSGPHTICCR